MTSSGRPKARVALNRDTEASVNAVGCNHDFDKTIDASTRGRATAA